MAKTKAKEPDDIFEADFWVRNDTGYDGVRGIHGHMRDVTPQANPAAVPVAIDPRALEGFMATLSGRDIVLLGGAVLLGYGLLKSLRD